MFDLFDFDLPGAVTEQLERRLRGMPSTPLQDGALEELGRLQERAQLKQGVYQILLEEEVVYIGKAFDVHERMSQHYRKVRGRLGIELEHVRFRSLLLHPNWSTSANENLLIAHFKEQGQCKWNSSGFGTKDVGKERDDTEPNRFDQEYPINVDYPCNEIAPSLNVGQLLQVLKKQLPFTFRFELQEDDASKPVDLSGATPAARSLIAAAVRTLGPDWQATLFLSHIILYKERRSYRHGQPLAGAG